jgi:hypothetical protein
VSYIQLNKFKNKKILKILKKIKIKIKIQKVWLEPPLGPSHPQKVKKKNKTIGRGLAPWWWLTIPMAHGGGLATLIPAEGDIRTTPGAPMALGGCSSTPKGLKRKNKKLRFGPLGWPNYPQGPLGLFDHLRSAVGGAQNHPKPNGGGHTTPNALRGGLTPSNRVWRWSATPIGQNLAQRGS